MYYGKTVHCIPLAICALWQTVYCISLATCALWQNSTLHFFSNLCTYGKTVHCITLYSPFTLLLFLSCFLAGSERCVFTGEGEEWPASPLLHAVAGRGSHACQLTKGRCSYTYICNSCSCNFSPGQYVSQDSCNKLKGDPFFMTHVCKLDFLSARHVSVKALDVSIIDLTA